MSTPTTIPVPRRIVSTPATRQGRAERLHRRMQIEHAYYTRARQELTTGLPGSAERAADILARGARMLAGLDAPRLVVVRQGSAA